jgi:hypothetical protein
VATGVSAAPPHAVSTMDRTMKMPTMIKSVRFIIFSPYKIENICDAFANARAIGRKFSSSIKLKP